MYYSNRFPILHPLIFVISTSIDSGNDRSRLKKLSNGPLSVLYNLFTYYFHNEQLETEFFSIIISIAWANIGLNLLRSDKYSIELFLKVI